MGKVESLGLEQDILDLTEQGYNPSLIEKVFKKQGIKISHMTIRRWLEHHKYDLEVISQKQSQFKEKLFQHTYDILQQFLLANQKTIAIFKKAFEEGDLPVALRAIERIEKQIQLHQELFPSQEMDLSFFYDSFPEDLRDEIRSVIEQYRSAPKSA